MANNTQTHVQVLSACTADGRTAEGRTARLGSTLPMEPEPRPMPDASPGAGALDDAAARAVLAREVVLLLERCEELDLQVSRLERKLSGVHNTLSFRLGHALIRSTKSLEDLWALPHVLGRLRRESRLRRRAQKTKR
jgi:hypothetical protein